MSMAWPEVLINGAMITLLGGLLWRSQTQRIDLVQKEMKGKVDRELCVLQHQGIREDVAEIKNGQDRMERTLDDIKLTLARENGRRSAELKDYPGQRRDN